MNIQYPPIEQCGIVWPKFVEWMALKMALDAMYSQPDGLIMPIHDITFRQLAFINCPFCGVKLRDRNTPISQRHP